MKYLKAFLYSVGSLIIVVAFFLISTMKINSDKIITSYLSAIFFAIVALIVVVSISTALIIDAIKQSQKK